MVLEVSIRGQAEEDGLGKYPAMSLVDASKCHGDARQLLSRGIDPMAVRKEVKEETKAERIEASIEKPNGFTFGDLARKWYAWWVPDRDKKYAKNVKTRIEGDLIAPLGDKLPAEITRMELVKVSQDVDARGARDIAKRNLQFVRTMYYWGLNNGLLDQNTLNPAASIRPEDILSQATEVHFASLPITEVPALLRKMRDYDGTAITRMAMELLSLTFLRTNELIGGLWSEIDWEDKRWNLPKERMKGEKGKKKPNIVPLAKQSITLLKCLHAITGDSGRLFPCANKANRRGVMSNNTILKALENMGYKGEMTGHGLRSIASTYLHEHEYDHDHIELQLGHSEIDKVSGAYNYAKYLKQRLVMMQAWADALDALRLKGARWAL